MRVGFKPYLPPKKLIFKKFGVQVVKHLIVMKSPSNDGKELFLGFKIFPRTANRLFKFHSILSFSTLHLFPLLIFQLSFSMSTKKLTVWQDGHCIPLSKEALNDSFSWRFVIPRLFRLLVHPVGTKGSRICSLVCEIVKLPRDKGRGVDLHVLFRLHTQLLNVQLLCTPKHKILRSNGKAQKWFSV